MDTTAILSFAERANGIAAYFLERGERVIMMHGSRPMRFLRAEIDEDAILLHYDDGDAHVGFFHLYPEEIPDLHHWMSGPLYFSSEDGDSGVIQFPYRESDQIQLRSREALSEVG